jgi:ribonuclease HI
MTYLSIQANAIGRKVINGLRHKTHNLICVPKYNKKQYELGIQHAKDNVNFDEIVFTDGSVRGSEKYAGIGLWYDTLDEHGKCYRILGNLDTNRTELAAIYTALSFSDFKQNLWIYTDSLTSISLIHKCYYNNETSNKYRILLENISYLTDKRIGRTIISKVPAHKDIIGNNNADKLAKTAPLNKYILLPDNNLKQVLLCLQNNQNDIVIAPQPFLSSS